MSDIDLVLSIDLPEDIDPKDFARHVKENLCWCQCGSEPMPKDVRDRIQKALEDDEISSTIECEVYRSFGA